MDQVLWLSGDDVSKTGVCELYEAVQIVEDTFRLFERNQAGIVPESAIRLAADGEDQAWYILPAFVLGEEPVCGLKWTAHGTPVDPAYSGRSRIQATLILNSPERSCPLTFMNGTTIGAARTAAVTAVALKRLAPKQVKKVALCGAGGQAAYQLRAVLSALPSVESVAIWSRGYIRGAKLAEAMQSQTDVCLLPVRTLSEAVEGADVLIGATSASEPYLTPEALRDVSLYCHIGFNEITYEAIRCFSYIIVDTWDEAKNVSGQSLFRMYRDGELSEDRITAHLGALVSGRMELLPASQNKKIMFDAFGLPIFDLALAKAAYDRAKEMGLGTLIPWDSSSKG